MYTFFIRKNTLKLRNKLKKLGYSLCPYTEFEDDCWLYVTPSTSRNVYVVGCTSEEVFPGRTSSALFEEFLEEAEESEYIDYIDCGTNEQMFLALAALREDTWKNQWIVTPKIKVKKLPGSFPQTCDCDGHYIEIIGYDWTICKDPNMYKEVQSHTKNEESDEFLPHKATVEEIIEHFKDESYE